MRHGRAIALIEGEIRMYEANGRTQMDPGEAAREAAAVKELRGSVEVLEGAEETQAIERTEGEEAQK